MDRMPRSFRLGCVTQLDDRTGARDQVADSGGTFTVVEQLERRDSRGGGWRLRSDEARNRISISDSRSLARAPPSRRRRKREGIDAEHVQNQMDCWRLRRGRARARGAFQKLREQQQGDASGEVRVLPSSRAAAQEHPVQPHATAQLGAEGVSGVSSGAERSRGAARGELPSR